MPDLLVNIVTKRPNFFYHLHPPTIPAEQASFSYTFGLGGLAVFLFLVVAFTGALLLFYYVPSAEQANDSIQLLTYHVPLGWLVRNLHYWSTQALVIVSILHLLRVILTGGSRPPRRFNWLLGLGLLLLLLGLDFTGYVLRWDVDMGWALLVGTNLVKEVPLIGGGLYRLVVGGSELGSGTVPRFFGWHVFGLLIPAAFLFGWHLFRVRRDGGISRPKPRPGRRSDKIGRELLLRREVLAGLIAGGILVILSVFFNPGLGAQLDPTQVIGEASAPWFFLWIQELLRWGDPLWMGVLIPLLLLILLGSLPYVFDRGEEGGRWFPRDGRRAQILAVSVIILITLLTLVGALR
jgi:quinol-cytochrome oxidoreductase complex cytochrome b subunit